MNGFNWFDRRGFEGVGFVRTLRTLLTNNMSHLIPNLGTLARIRWAESVAGSKGADGVSNETLSGASDPRS
jgi:hypothetical protein